MNDEELGELTRSAIPPRGPEYWANVTAALEAVDNENTAAGDTISENRDTTPPGVRLTNMTTYPHPANNPKRPRMQTRILAAAAAVSVLALGSALLLRANVDSSTDVATRDVSTSEPGLPAGSKDAPASSPDVTEDDNNVNDQPSTSPDDAAPVDSSPEEPAVVNQAEPDLKFDFGDLASYEILDGTEWIWFDRWSFGDQQGVELDAEPRYELATDFHGGGNVNTKLRSYPLASDVSVLILDPKGYERSCGGDDGPVQFVETDVSSMLALEGQVSLTFNSDNEVTVIRDQRGC